MGALNGSRSYQECKCLTTGVFLLGINAHETVSSATSTILQFSVTQLSLYCNPAVIVLQGTNSNIVTSKLSSYDAQPSFTDPASRQYVPSMFWSPCGIFLCSPSLPTTSRK